MPVVQKPDARLPVVHLVDHLQHLHVLALDQRDRHAAGIFSNSPIEQRAGDMGWIVSRQSAPYAEEDGWTREDDAQFLTTFDPARERCCVAERNEPVLVPS